jgi:hypothetical protein
MSTTPTAVNPKNGHLLATVCRSVHYVDGQGVHRAAIVTALIDPKPGEIHPYRRLGVRIDDGDVAQKVELCVFGLPAQTVSGRETAYRSAVPHDPTGKAIGSWHWPEREG